MGRAELSHNNSLRGPAGGNARSVLQSRFLRKCSSDIVVGFVVLDLPHALMAFPEGPAF